MSFKLTHLSREEILRYLSWKGTPIPPSLENTLERCMKEMMELCHPRYFYRRFPISVKESAVEIMGTSFVLPGRDIARHLQHSREVFFLCATLGLSVDQLLRQRMLTAPEEAVILDACATAAIEEVADHAQQEIQELCEKEGKGITWRFSPGYGDFPLESQKWILPFLDAPRKIGLTVTDSLLMVPGKSVTAVLGVTEVPAPTETKDLCQRCPNRESCAYRKRGNLC